jgi:beta-glucosidase
MSHSPEQPRAGESRAGEPHLSDLVAELTIEEKVKLLTGRDFWTTWPIERIGLRSIVFSDGPSGVRGPSWDERSPSLNLPSGSALSSAWDPAIAYGYASRAAAEARRKGVDVVLGPTINLHRSPLGGRHFEAFSEDPFLTSELAASYVSGLQDNGVAASPKHYIANDSETDRFTIDVRVDDRTIREVYLLAFEKAVVESRAWTVMSSYNSINGITATENELLETPLNSEWGFDGVVVSDWTAVRSLAAARAAQDLAMPGPTGAWGDALLAAVRDGSVEESAIDRKVERILRLARRVGALDTGGAQSPAASTGSRASGSESAVSGETFAKDAAIDGMVLLTNRNELPWDAATLRRVAVIGNNALDARTQGGGSATVIPEHVISPLDGIQAALPQAEVDFAVGAVTQSGLTGFRLDEMRNPATGLPGARVTFRDASGEALLVEDRQSTALVWFGDSAPLAESREVEVELVFTPSRTERADVGCAATGEMKLWLDDELVLDEHVLPDGEDLGAAFLSPGLRTVVRDLEQDVPVRVRFTLGTPERADALAGALSLSVGTRPADQDAAALIAQAAELAARSDVAVVVVGTNAEVESEGYDRDSLRLPGRQDDLVRAVVAANPRTVVIVNSGAPVLLPWRDEVAAVLIGWFGGQEFGSAIAEVLLGLAEPGGRLPTTWPAETSDVPVLETRPTDGELVYSEGIHIGYRAWLRVDVPPAYWFGHGLGYTTFRTEGISGPLIATADGSIAVEVTVTNTGRRAGKHVVQIYADRAVSAIDRPVRWLVGFATARVGAGESAVITVSVPGRMLAHWDDGWQLETGEYRFSVGASAGDLGPSTMVYVPESALSLRD